MLTAVSYSRKEVQRFIAADSGNFTLADTIKLGIRGSLEPSDIYLYGMAHISQSNDCHGRPG